MIVELRLADKIDSVINNYGVDMIKTLVKINPPLPYIIHCGIINAI